jgi:hypothetical protein
VLVTYDIEEVGFIGVSNIEEVGLIPRLIQERHIILVIRIRKLQPRLKIIDTIIVHIYTYDAYILTSARPEMAHHTRHPHQKTVTPSQIAL